MSETANPVAASIRINPSALRIVLFGMPDAGKSSLLGALAQAAQTQEHVLHGRLTDVTQGLAELQRRLYDAAPRETLEEVVPYPITYEPFIPGGPQADWKDDHRLEAVLVDCDGRVANELLSRHRALNQSGDGTLANAILRAEALVLVVDVSAAPSQIDTDFAEFARFLRLLEQSRGQRTDVAGLPVFLVLTKCDLLARPEEPPETWLKEIEERKIQVGRRFQNFLATEKGNRPSSFGSINVHLWATAVHHPALQGSPPKPREPFGVAELFRQCLEESQLFRSRQVSSSRRLVRTVAGTAAIVLLMGGLMVGLLATRPEAQISNLAAKIDNYRSNEPVPSVRLREPLERRLGELIDFKSDPEFAALPQEKKDYVEERVQEIKDYQAYKEKLDRIGSPVKVRGEEELSRIENLLQNELAVPEKHKKDWSQTSAALHHVRLLAECRTIREAVAKNEQECRRLILLAERLYTFADGKPADSEAWKAWHEQVERMLDESKALITGQAPDDVLRFFKRLVDAQKDLDKVRQRLERLRDWIDAVGFAAPFPARDTPLAIPEKFQVEQAPKRLEDLRKNYISLLTGPVEVPEALAGDLRRAAGVRYQRLLEAGREVVLKHFQQACPDKKEAPACWKKAGTWLEAPDALRDWNVLAGLLARLQNPEAIDPVASLVEFLKQDRFDLELKRFVLEIPYDLKVRPEEALTVYHRSADGPARKYSFKVDGDGRRDSQRRVTAYTLQAGAETTIAYQPGDLLWAELPLKKEGSSTNWKFTWSLCRSQIYQFERLVRQPRLHLKDQENTAGELAPGVLLTVSQGRLPPVPDLLPVVQFQK